MHMSTSVYRYMHAIYLSIYIILLMYMYIYLYFTFAKEVTFYQEVVCLGAFLSGRIVTPD